MRAGAAIRGFATCAALLAAAMAAALPARAEDGVRVVLPLELDGLPADGELERIDPDAEAKAWDTAAICDLISASAEEHGLPKPYFARLIWRESRFDINAVSPAGAQGVAQFMPATAMRRKLRDAFDPQQAIPASAAYLAELRKSFGNLGLAAAAYNAGEERVTSWLVRGGYLPYETQNYVMAILGKSAEEFREATTDDEQRPLDREKSFDAACRALPVAPASPIFNANVEVPAWGAQIAGNFDGAVARRQWERLRTKHRSILGDREAVIFAKRGAIGRKRMLVVQIGASDRREASDLCNRLRIAGAACVVVRN